MQGAERLYPSRPARILFSAPCYGSEAANLPLKIMVTAAVYLDGGIAPKKSKTETLGYSENQECRLRLRVIQIRDNLLDSAGAPERKAMHHKV